MLQVQEQLQVLHNVCIEMKNCEPFLKLLQAVLELGNHLNAGTHRGCAAGFKLDTLLKLADIKAIDRKTSLLQFVIGQLRKQDASIENLANAMPHARPASTVLLSALTEMLDDLRKGLKGIAEEILVAQDNMKSHDGAGRFAKVMNSFYQQASLRFSQLEEKDALVLEQLKNITTYYGEDFNEQDPLRIVKIVQDFLVLFNKALNDIKAKEEKQMKATKSGALGAKQPAATNSQPKKEQDVSGTPRSTIQVNVHC